MITTHVIHLCHVHIHEVVLHWFSCTLCWNVKSAFLTLPYPSYFGNDKFSRNMLLHLLSFYHSPSCFDGALEHESLLLLSLPIWGLYPKYIWMLLLLITNWCSFSSCVLHVLVLLHVREVSAKGSHVMISLINESVLEQRVVLSLFLSEPRGCLSWRVLIVAMSLEVVVVPCSGSILLMQWHYLERM